MTTAAGSTVDGTLVDQDGDDNLDGVDLDGNTSDLELVFLESASASAYAHANTSAEAGTVYAVDLNGDGVADFYLRILDVSTGTATYAQYSKLEVTGDDFKGWNKDLQTHWRYAIAFAAYGMPSLCLVAPEECGTAKHMMAVMIDKMKSKKVWRDFVDHGMGSDPFTYENIMKGSGLRSCIQNSPVLFERKNASLTPSC